jgi:hypothetical protein
MYLNAERIAILNKAVQDTFEQSSVAWQAIPHWDVGDPGQLRVRSDEAYADEATGDVLSPPIKPGDSLKLDPESVRFAVTVAQAIAPTPDALLAAVITRTVQLAARVDRTVIGTLIAKAQGNPTVLTSTTPIQDVLNALIEARAQLENHGYRSPSCLLTDTAGLKALNYLDDGVPELQALLTAANVNSLFRVDQLGSDKGQGPAKGSDPAKVADEKKGSEGKPGDPGQKKVPFNGQLLLLGRRQRIAHGGAAATSPGEEPVDLAVSVPPSLEVVGETDDGHIELAVRIRFAPRITDKNGVVGVI